MGDYQSALVDISHLKDNLSTIKSDVEEVKEIITHETVLREHHRENKSLQKLYDRVAPVSPVGAHKKICAVWRDSPSGQWFLEGPLETWLSTTEPSTQLMALTGVSGAGKSTIVSQVANHVAGIHPDLSVAFYYCLYNEVVTHDVRNVLGSWLVQLWQEGSRTDLSAFEQHLASGTEIPVETLQTALIEAANVNGPILLVLDALNESTQSKKLVEALSILLQGSKQIRILVSSTFSLEITSDSLELALTSITMSPESIKVDVIEYIKKTIETYDILKAVGEETILQAVVPRTQGMFRWASCQMNVLSEYLTVNMVRKALKDLPGSLDDIYVILLQRVQPMFKSFVREALLWLTCAYRPLSLSELNEAIVVEIGETSIDESCRIHPPQRILEICRGLIVWDQANKTISLAHNSVSTFLQSGFIRTSPAAYFAIHRGEAMSAIIQKSLSYLMMDEFKTGSCESRDLPKRYTNYPLLKYASTMWAMHASEAVCIHESLGETETRLILQLLWTHRTLPGGGNFSVWIQGLLPHVYQDLIRTATPLYYAASFGMTPVVTLLFERGQIDVKDSTAPWYIDRPCGRGWSTPLIAACFRGHTDVARILLEHGAQPNAVDAIGVSGRAWARMRGYSDLDILMEAYGGELHNYVKYAVDPVGGHKSDETYAKSMVALPTQNRFTMGYRRSDKGHKHDLKT